MEKLFVLHFTDGFGPAISFHDTLDSAKERMEIERSLDYVRFNHDTFKFIEVVTDEYRATQLIEDSISTELGNYLFNEGAFGCWYEILYNEHILMYITTKRAGWEALKEKFWSLFDYKSLTKFTLQEWTATINRAGKNTIVSLVDEEGYAIKASSDEGVMDTYHKMIADMAEHFRDDEGSGGVDRAYGAIKSCLTNHLREIQGWKEVNTSEEQMPEALDREPVFPWEE